MNRKSFWQILRKNYGYTSPDIRHFPAERIPGCPTFLYYVRIMKVIFDHSRIAAGGRYTREIWADGSHAMIRAAEAVGGKVEISGMEGLARHSGPLVFIANHMSMIETFFLPASVLAFKDVSFVVKTSLLDYPFFGKVMRAVEPVAVSRQNPREDLRTVLEKGSEFLAAGRSVIVFPQATRSLVFDPEHFNSLGIKLARKAGVQVVPVALKTDFQGYSPIFKDLGCIDPRKIIHICFGTPRPVEGKGQKTHEDIVKFIAENIILWGGNVRNIPHE
ncbi:MAG: lysophospholipid acyltransferase family protein [Desulfococcaceae bacterium]